MTLPSEYEGTELVHKFQSLQAGQYWRAKEAVGDYIKSDFVLLIQSIKWVDNKPHTIILRAHPSVFGRVESHQYLLDDFMQKFEYEPNHKEIRERELAEVQGRLQDLQDELVKTQADPAKMNLIVDAALKAEAGEGGAELPAISNTDAQNFVAGGVMGAIGTGITTVDIENMKVAANREHKIATIKAQWIQKQTSKMAETIAKMTPFYQEQAACALAQTEEVRTYVKELMQGIESLDLYVGKEVDVTTIKQGRSAPEDEPLSLIQKKLIMDEELAVHMDIGEWFDFQRADLFFEELAKNPRLVDQIFPTTRCVLVMATTRRYIDYGDPYASMFMNAKNQAVFLLVRDGDNLYKVHSPVETHLGTSRLFPSKDDQERIFQGYDGSQITFNDLAYTSRLETHEKHALHYKRFLILLCGLDHRLNLLGKFYEGPKTMHFVSAAFQEKYCRFIHDDDGEGMLPNPDQRPSVHEWVNAMNKYLRPGSRFFAYWPGFVTLENCPVMYNKSQSMRDSDRYRINNPVQEYSVEKVQRSGRDLVIKIEAESRYGNRDKFMAKVTINPKELEHRTNGVCLDAVEEEDIEYYIHHRDSRVNHIEYIRLFKHMLKLLQAERMQEKATREYMLDALNKNNIGNAAERQDLVNRSVIAWRAENNGKELPVGGAAAGKALQPLLDQMYYLANIGKSNEVDLALQVINQTGCRPIRISRNGKARLVAYASLKPEQDDHVLEQNPFLNRFVLEANGSDYCIKSSSLDVLPEKSASEITLFESDDAESFIKTSVFQTDKVKQRYLKILSESRAIFERYSQSLTEAEFEYELKEFKRVRREKTKKRVVNPNIYVPIGMYKYPTFTQGGKPEVAMVYLVADHAALIYHNAPNDGCRQRLRREFIDIYANTQAAFEIFRKEISSLESHQLWRYSTSAMLNDDLEKNRFSNIFKRKHQFTYQAFISDVFDEIGRYHGSKGPLRMFIDPTLRIDGKFCLDHLLKISPPADFEPMRVFSMAESFSKNECYVVTRYEDAIHDLSRDFKREHVSFNVNHTNEIYFTTKVELQEYLESRGVVLGEMRQTKIGDITVDIYLKLESEDGKQ